MADPRPNWWIFNRVSLMPAAGIFLIGAGLVQSNAWLIVGGAATTATGTWLTMRRLSGRISERSLAWVLLDTTTVLAGAAVVFALHLSGVALVIAVGVPAIASDLIATAVTGVREAG
jgi:hypothetical protein